MNVSYIENLAKRLLYPTEAIEFLFSAAMKVNATREASVSFNEALWAFEKSNWSFDGMKYRFLRISELTALCEYTVAMLFLMSACEDLEKRYSEAGYDNSLFIDTMSDLRFKLIECKTVKGVWGTFVASWYPGFFNMTRFALGRFQYEKREYSHDCYGVGGHFVRRGDTVLNFHIPSSGVSLKDEIRYDSYRRARDFFFPEAEGAVPFVCSSWLLWPEYESYIPDGLNLKRFRHDFTVVATSESDTFSNAWRVFGDKAELPASELPRDTAQRRLFAEYCESGKKHGHGYGVFLFDGEKIVK